ncbi:MAG: hypothetical protein ACK43M_11655 [Allorhizobium sp.]
MRKISSAEFVTENSRAQFRYGTIFWEGIEIVLFQEFKKQDSKFADRHDWTTEEDYCLLEMRQADVSIPEICIALNRSFGSVQTRLSRKGSGIRRVKVVRKQWTAAETAKLHDMRAAGRDMFEIAEALGRTESAIYAKLMKFGVGKKTALDEAKSRTPAAQSQRQDTKKLGRNEKGIRECPKCKGPFLSWGAGNRVCQPCKSKDPE